MRAGWFSVGGAVVVIAGLVWLAVDGVDMERMLAMMGVATGAKMVAMFLV